MEYPFKDLMPLDEAMARDGYYEDWTHIDADTFHQISELVKFIREKGYGSDTREAIAQALERVYHDAAKSGNANMEVSMARKHFEDLASRLDASDDELSSAIAQLAQKADKEFVEKEIYKMGDGTPESFENLSAIKSAYPNGDVYVKLNTEDGFIYKWTGSDWVQGWVYQSSDYQEGIEARYSETLSENFDSLNERLSHFEKASSVILGNKVSSGFQSIVGWEDDYPDGESSTIKQVDSKLIITGTGEDPNLQVVHKFKPSSSNRIFVNLKFKTPSNCKEVRLLFDDSGETFYLTLDDFPNGVENEYSRILEVSQASRFKIVFSFDSTQEASGSVVEMSELVLVDLPDILGQLPKTVVERKLTDYALKRDLVQKGYVNVLNLDQRVKGEFSNLKISSLEAYGIYGDGSSDYSNLIQKAIDENDVIYVEEGNYLLSTTITVGSNKKIIAVGDATFLLQSDDFNLRPYEWRANSDMPSYYPYFIVENANNVYIEGIRIRGSSSESAYREQIQVGLMIESSSDVTIKDVSIERINYYATLVPPRPAGQWRRGWNLATMRSENVVIDGGNFERGAYECVRIGDYSKNVTVQNATLNIGWRTVLQLLRGCENIKILNNEIIQDDFGRHDTHAIVTFHPAVDEEIKNVLFEGNTIKGQLFTEHINNGIAVSFVDTFTQNITFRNNEIDTNGMGIVAFGKNIEISGNTVTTGLQGIEINAADYEGGSNTIKENTIFSGGVSIISAGQKVDSINISENICTSENDHTIYINHIPDLKNSIIAYNVLEPNNLKDGVLITSGTNFVNGFINNNTIHKGDYGFRGTNVSDTIVKDNILKGTSRGINIPSGNLVSDNILPS